MKKLLINISLVIAAIVAMGTFEVSAQEAKTLFLYPQIPDSITNIDARYDYYVSHFWDRANTKAVFSSKKRFADAFEDFVVPLRYATADTVHASVKKFMGSLEKQPNDMLYVGQLAEDLLYSDSALYVSDELYLDFIKPILRNKRIDRNLKARYESQYIRLNNTLQGRPMAAIPYTNAADSTMVLEPRPGVPLIIFLSDPECTDCRLAGTRLKADGRTAQLVEAGLVDVAVISAVEPDDAAWREYAKSFPETWIVGTNPQLDMIIDMRGGTPSFYILDEAGRIAVKNINVDTVLAIMSRM